MIIRLLHHLAPTDGLILVAGGAWTARLINPAVDVLHTAPSFAIMARAGNGWWAALFGAALGYLLWTLWSPARNRARGRAYVVWACIFFFIGFLLHMATPDAPGDGVYAGLTTACAWAYLWRRWSWIGARV